MNPDLQQLHPYPFQKLNALLGQTVPPADQSPIVLSIGEPRHPTPELIGSALTRHLDGLRRYPLTRGERPLRETIANWLETRFNLGAASVDPDRQVLPVNGTREALFAFAQAVVNRSPDAVVAMPNPFYQIYEGAALLAGARPVYLNTPAENAFVADFEAVPAATWRACQLVYLCSPGNPTGAVLSLDRLRRLIELADRYDFIIAGDECYSEIYNDEEHPPPGLLQACAAMGRNDYRHCVVFHSLSKRSNAPGLRSGFVAGDASVLDAFFQYRTYHGCAMAPPTQAASRAAWADEEHVRDNRRLYRAKFDAVLEVLDGVLPVQRPAGGFYLWPRTPIDDQAFTLRLYADYNLTVLPGSYLSRNANGADPGRDRIRIALVASLEDCVEAARRIRACVQDIRMDCKSSRREYMSL